MRNQNIQLLQQLLGFPGGSPGADRFASSGIGIAAQGGRNQGGMANRPPGDFGGDPLARLQQFFGQLGSPQSGLQRQGGDALGAMLGQPTPEQRALDISLPQLQAMLTGQGPQFERDIAMGNQQGGRFGSANAIFRGEAMRNLYNLRNQTAGTLGMLSGNAGQANRGLAGQAFGMGQQQAQQGDIETQRRLQILMQLLGVSQQASFNVPTQQTPSFLQQLMGVAGTALPFLTGGGGGAAAAGAGATGGGFSAPAFGSSGGYGNIDPFTGRPR